MTIKDLIAKLEAMDGSLTLARPIGRGMVELIEDCKIVSGHAARTVYGDLVLMPNGQTAADTAILLWRSKE